MQSSGSCIADLLWLLSSLESEAIVVLSSVMELIGVKVL